MVYVQLYMIVAKLVKEWDIIIHSSTLSYPEIYYDCLGRTVCTTYFDRWASHNSEI